MTRDTGYRPDHGIDPTRDANFPIPPRPPTGGSAGQMKGNHGSGYQGSPVATMAEVGYTQRQLTLLDLAAKCPDAYIAKIRDALIDRGIIPAERRKRDALNSYSEQEREQLNTALRFEWAEMMLSHLDTLAITRPHIPRR